MAATPLAISRIAYIGLSTDAKPSTNVQPGATFYETDTGRHYIFDGSAWQPLVTQYGFNLGGTLLPSAHCKAI
jgi:hypothetical protein